MTNGLVYLFTGDGKGKTSAALGVLVRGLANGWKVGWISWYKEASWGISEHHLQDMLNEEARKRLIFLPMGKGFYLKDSDPTVKAQSAAIKITKANTATIVDDAPLAAHRAAARAALQKAAELCPTVDLLVLDEVCNAVSDGLLNESDVLACIQSRGKTHLILTGRSATHNLQKAADLVSEIQKKKHPFDVGKMAVKGLDF